MTERLTSPSSFFQNRWQDELEEDGPASRWPAWHHDATSRESSADSQGGQGDPDGQQGGHLCDIRSDSQYNMII